VWFSFGIGKGWGGVVTYILNSACFVMLPSMKEPPMMLTSLTWSATSGNAARSRATFVNAPVATSYVSSIISFVSFTTMEAQRKHTAQVW